MLSSIIHPYRLKDTPPLSQVSHDSPPLVTYVLESHVLKEIALPKKNQKQLH